MASATASQAPDNARRAFVREVGRLVGEMRRMSLEMEQCVVLLAQKKCPATDLAIESCEQCQNAALGNVPFVLSKRRPHLSELKAMINAFSPALWEIIRKSSAFN